MALKCLNECYSIDVKVNEMGWTKLVVGGVVKLVR